MTSVAGAVSVGSAGWKSVVGRSVAAAPGPFWRGMWVEGRSCEEDMMCVCGWWKVEKVSGCETSEFKYLSEHKAVSGTWSKYMTS